MHLVTYDQFGQARIGARLGEQIVDLNRAHKAKVEADNDPAELAVAEARLPTDMMALLRQGPAGLEAVTQAVEFVQARQAAAAESMAKKGILLSMAQITLLPPILRPEKLVCLGLNYRAHAAEGNWAPPDYPMLFHKTANCLIGDGQAIVAPRVSDQIDYEGELAVIIGRRGKHIAETEALSYVAGYAVANDVSARDLQTRTRQFTTGKMLDTFCPLGPALVTSDEIADPNNLEIKTTLNGQVMQHSNTQHMIFAVPFIISYISEFATLEPGDIILTGTPEGVGKARDPQVFLKPGDTITVEIENVGTLTNPVVAEV